MKKLIILLLLSLPVITKAQFANLTAKQIVTQDIIASGSFRPGLDTVVLPKWLGEKRIIIAGGIVDEWVCVSLSGPKRWDRPRVDGNNFLTGFSFNGGTEVLSANRSGLSAVTVDLSGNWTKVQRFLDSIQALKDYEIYFVNGPENATLAGVAKVKPAGDSVIFRSIEVLALGGLVGTRDTTPETITYNINLPSQTGQNGKVLGTNGTTASWVTVGAGSGVTTVGTIAPHGTANGASITGTTLNLHKVSLTTGGVLTTGIDSIAGNKFVNGRWTFHDFDIHSTREADDNFYRGFRMFRAGGGDVGGLLYNATLNRIAIGEFSGLGSAMDIYANGTNVLSFSSTNVATMSSLSGTGNRLVTANSTGDISSAITYIKHQENADFGSVSAQNSSSVTMSVAGSIVGDLVLVQSTQNPAGIVFTARISTNGTLTLTAHNYSSSPIDPANSTFTFLIYR